MHANNERVISVTGEEKSGKSTVAKIIEEYLSDIGIDNDIISIYGSSEYGAYVKELEDKGTLMTYSVSTRGTVLATVLRLTSYIDVIPMSRSGCVPILDRSYPDILTKFFAVDEVDYLCERIATKMPLDIVFHVRCDFDTLTKRWNRPASTAIISHHEKMYEETFAKYPPNNLIIVDNNGTVDELERQIFSELDKIFIK